MDYIDVLLQALIDYNGIIGMGAVLIVAVIILLMVKTVKKSVKEITQPYVVLYLTKMQNDEAVNYFVLENFGKRAALNIAVNMNPELRIEYPKDNPFPLFFEYRISVLAPAQRIVSAVPSGNYLEQRYGCTITYQDDQNNIYTRKQIMDFSYVKQLLFSPSPENRIAKSMDRIVRFLDEK